MAKKSEKIVFYGTGRRKKSISRVRLIEGKGEITVNGMPLDEYFGTEILKVIVKQPLTATNMLYAKLKVEDILVKQELLDMVLQGLY